jgi:hypothetical protein
VDDVLEFQNLPFPGGRNMIGKPFARLPKT